MPDRAHSSVLSIISRLENADKHRELITISTGLERPKVIVTTRDGRIERSPTGFGPNQFLRDGAEIKLKVPVPFTSDPEVRMEFRGTASISISIAHGGRNEPPSEFHLYRTMISALGTVRIILRKLEPFAVR